jgi:type IV secretion system protein VirB2
MKKNIIWVALFLGMFGIFFTNEASASSYSGIGIETATDTSGGEMQTVLCNVLKFVTGGIGKTIASFIIIGVGLGFFTGKVSWGVLIGVTLGISAMFGAPAIVGAITGGGTKELCATTGTGG